MKSDWLYHLRFSRPTQLAVAFTLVMPGLILAVMSFFAQSIGDAKIRAAVDKISEKTGISISIEHQTIGLTKVNLTGIEISGFETARIENAQLDLNINPFSRDFLKVDNIELSGVSGEARESDDGLRYLRSAVAAEEDEDLQSPLEEARHGTSSLDKYLSESCKILVSDLNGAVEIPGGHGRISVSNAHLIVLPRQRQLSFRLGQITHSSGNSFQDLKGSFAIGPDGEFTIKVEGIPRADGKQWAVATTVRKVAEKYHASYDINGLPQLVSKHLEVVIEDPETLSFQGEIKAEVRDDGSMKFSGETNFSPLNIHHQFLSSGSIGPIVPQAKFAAAYDAKKRLFILKKLIATLYSPEVTLSANFPGIQFGVSLKGDLNNPRAPVGVWTGILKVPKTACQTALEVAPTGLTPGIKDFRLSGDFALDADLRLDTEFPDRYYFQPLRSSFGCKSTVVPTEFSAERLRRPFSFTREMPDLTTRTFYLEPNSRDFTPINLISRNMLMAVVASEDAGFWANDGIDFNAIDYAMRNNLKSRKVMAGGSTITMQTVKNLYLSQTRNISRKAQEVFLSWHLNQTLPKERILEIYLNIIEFGPGIYGITEAASHFFNKKAADLNLKESAYLASVLPSPVKRYRQFCNGKTSEAYEQLIGEKLSQMHGQGRISIETASDAQSLILIFNSQTAVSKAICNNLDDWPKPRKA
jgi:hypothetical protein